jgi:hypothetical protein
MTTVGDGDIGEIPVKTTIQRTVEVLLKQLDYWLLLQVVFTL